MDAEPEAVQAGKLHRLPSGEWYVLCKWCQAEARLAARDEEEAYGMLKAKEWRLSMPGKPYKNRNWSCPTCRHYFDKEPTTTNTAGSAATDTAGSAGQLADAAATSFDALQLEVVALKAEVVELKAEVERLRWEVHGHYAHVRERDEEILARTLQMVRREIRRRAVPDDTRDAVDIAVPEEAEETSHDG